MEFAACSCGGRARRPWPRQSSGCWTILTNGSVWAWPGPLLRVDVSGEAGRRVVHEKFDMRVSAAQLAGIYRELAADTRRRK